MDHRNYPDHKRMGRMFTVDLNGSDPLPDYQIDALNHVLSQLSYEKVQLDNRISKLIQRLVASGEAKVNQTPLSFFL
jgi:hypothetical protein